MESYLDALKHIESLKKIALALSAEKNIDEFFKLVLEETIEFTQADAGTIYTISNDQKHLDFQIVCTISKKYQVSRADMEHWPSVPIFNQDGTSNLNNFVTYVFHTGKILNIEDVYKQEIFDNSGTKKYDIANNYHSKSMLGIPLKNHEDKVLGVLQLINAIGENFELISFTREHIAMVTSIASQAAIALTNRNLIFGLENLLDQFIKAIADTIDKKSKYTGGHISRVADLTLKIARRIHEDHDFYEKVFFNDDQIKELSIASWMHDLGKITTPSQIMDKSSKLETIFNRIQMIKTRYNFIRDMLLNELELQNKQNTKESLSIEKKLKKIKEDWEFIQKINFEENSISSADISRIEKIFNYKYKINNKEYELIDLKEKEHLQIAIGTLSEEESKIMKDHALVTHQILSGLTFPKKYSNVTLYASMHHETLNGTGYPFNLKADSLPLQARIIAIADIFESLTARDRPYKTPKKLSITLTILANKANRNEIDPHLMDLILDSGLYMDFAREYLSPEQIDEVDLKEIKLIYKSHGKDIT